MKLFNHYLNKITTDVLDTIDSRQKLLHFISTPLYRNALYLILNRIVTSFLGFFFWMACARFYSLTEVGFGSAIVAALNLIALLGLAGMNFSIIRFLARTENPQGALNSSFTLTGLFSLVMAAIFLAGLNIWSPALGFVRQNIVFFLTFIFTASLLTLSNLMDSVFVARRRAGLVLSKNATISLLRIPLLIAFVIWFHTFGVVAAWGVAVAISLSISTFLFLPRVEAAYKPALRLDLNYVMRVSYYSGNSYLVSILSQTPRMLLPLIVVNLLGTESAAYFYIAWMIADFTYAITRSISRSLFVEGSYLEANLHEDVTRSIKFSFLLLVPVVTVLIVSAKWILFAFGEIYSSNATELLWLLGFTSFPRAVIQIYMSILRVQFKLRNLIMIQGFIAVTVPALSFLIIPIYGIIGIGYVWLGINAMVSIILAPRLITQARCFSGNEEDEVEETSNF